MNRIKSKYYCIFSLPLAVASVSAKNSDGFSMSVNNPKTESKSSFLKYANNSVLSNTNLQKQVKDQFDVAVFLLLRNCNHALFLTTLDQLHICLEQGLTL